MDMKMYEHLFQVRKSDFDIFEKFPKRGDFQGN
jgi:hypothetical protein